MWFYGKESFKASHQPVKFSSLRHCGGGNIFSWSYYPERPCDQGVMLLDRQEPLMGSDHPAKFCDHRYSGSGDMVLICHVILQDPLT